MKKRIEIWLVLILFASIPTLQAGTLDRFPDHADHGIDLYVGRVETLRFSEVKRVAVGNEALVATSILSSDEVLILPRAPGRTEMVIWLAGERKHRLTLRIRAADPLQLKEEAVARLQRFPDLVFENRAGELLVKGQVNTDEQLQEIKSLLGDELLSNIHLQVEVNPEAIIRASLAHIEGLEMEFGPGWVHLKGSYAPEYHDLLEQISQKFPTVMNTARMDLARLKAMILVDVQILEVRHRELEKLGIRWDSAVNGPGVEIEVPGSGGSVGLLTQIGSKIEMMKESGEARMLARPMLSTRDGTPSSFHSGGEIPFPVVDPRTGAVSVDFHSYGVQLTILPRISEENLLVEIEAEVSSIDSAISINGIPGLVSKSVRSVVNTKAGETIVLSGLLSSEEDHANTRLPLLGDIPVLGRLFGSSMEDTNQRELAIFLTPRIHDRTQATPLNPAVALEQESPKAAIPSANPLNTLATDVTEEPQSREWLDRILKK